MAELTPLILMAGQGLLYNDALGPSTELTDEIATYTGLSLASKIALATNAINGDAWNDPANLAGIKIGTTSTFNSIISTIPDVLRDVIPSTHSLTIDGTNSFSAFLNNHVSTNSMSSNREFIVRLQIAFGYISGANNWINGAVNGATTVAQTFTSMDALMTGNISAVNKFTQVLGQDLINTGKLMNFGNIDILGTPQSLIQTLVTSNLLVSIAAELAAVGIDVFELQDAINDNLELVMKPTAQKYCYAAFEVVTGQKLTDILTALGVTTTGIVTLADLLNPVKIFPTSYQTITSLDNGVLKNIYIDELTTAPYVVALETPATLVMPEDIAKANAALITSLGQIKNIRKTTPYELGEQALSLETNQGLSIIDALAEPLPADVLPGIQGIFGSGTGPNGTYYLTDIMGSVAGTPHIENLALINSTMALIYTTAVEDILDDIVAMIAAQGPDRDTAMIAFNGLLETAVDTMNATYAVETAILTDAFDNSIAAIFAELTVMNEADIGFEDTFATSYNVAPGEGAVSATDSAVLSFSENLHTYGKFTNKGDIAEILEKTATNTRGGQAVVAAMREGRNLQKLTASGLAADNKIDDTPEIIEPGDIKPSTY